LTAAAPAGLIEQGTSREDYMKIGILGLDLPEGKVKYQDDKVTTLEKKFSARKVTPFYAEFLKDDPDSCDGFVVAPESLLDLLILDMEKVEAHRDRTTDVQEKELMEKCLALLEQEIPLCDGQFDPEEMARLRALAPLSLKPTVIVQEPFEINGVIAELLRRAGIIFFYTAGPKEVRSWPVRRDSDIVTCAGKIHSDLARGFIKADIVNYDDFIKVYNMQEARAKGLVKLVDRDYTIQEGDIIEIRFNI
jgi:ribosome-binding ATPase